MESLFFEREQLMSGWVEGWTDGRTDGRTNERTNGGWMKDYVLPKMLVFQHVFLQHVVQTRVCPSSDATNNNKAMINNKKEKESQHQHR